jgi:hypothetical protein
VYRSAGSGLFQRQRERPSPIHAGRKIINTTSRFYNEDSMPGLRKFSAVRQW